MFNMDCPKSKRIFDEKYPHVVEKFQLKKTLMQVFFYTPLSESSQNNRLSCFTKMASSFHNE